MSIWHTIAAVFSFFSAFLLWGLTYSLLETVSTDSEIAALFICLMLWFVFIVWLWIGLIRIAHNQGPEKLGFKIFPFIQAVFIVMMMTLPFGGLELLAKLMPVLLAIDIAIGVLMFNFLLLAWCARCKIPRGTYIQTASIILMIAVQIWLMNR